MIYKNYVITHKKFTMPNIDDSYVTIQVGNGENLGYLRDNTGDNISSKNKNYCELTAMYWIWKNDNTSTVIGISHYRRFFSNAFFSFSTKRFLKKKDVNSILKRYDCILSKPIHFHINLKKQYIKTSGYENDLIQISNTIKKLYPSYLDAYNKVMNKKYFSPYNMIIINKKEFDNYCQWLFSILFSLESEIDITDYTDYEKRIFGFISERLLNVWVLHHHYKIKYKRVVNPFLTSKEKKDFFFLNFKIFIKNILYLGR